MNSKLYDILFKIILVIFTITAAGCNDSKKGDFIEFEVLNYSVNDFSPIISSKTMNLHHGVHYRGYVKRANIFSKDFGFSDKDPYKVLTKIYGKDKYLSLYNNLGQAINHSIFFKSIKPNSPKPSDFMIKKIDESFGSHENFNKEFKKAAKKTFGSGWAWLVLDDKKLKIVTTSNADNPVTQGMTPLFAIDLWEHSYYLDYQNKRIDYVDAVLKNLVNWEFVENKYKAIN